MRALRHLGVLCLVGLAALSALAKGKATHVVLVVWDGMRPDFVNETNTPTLAKLMKQGVEFRHHHSVYVCSTEVNAAALATGGNPEQSKVIGNEEFRPAIDPLGKTMTAELAAIRKGDEATAGHYLGLPTMAEQLQHLGWHTAVAGTKPVAILQDRAPHRENSLGVDLFDGRVLPDKWARAIDAELGPFPKNARPRTNRDRWTTEALLTVFWKNEVPPLSILWLSEPDYSQHGAGPGSPIALAGIRSSDDNLARVLDALDRRNLREQTDVILVSDHGFSTIHGEVKLAEALQRGGFRAFGMFPATGSRPGDILVVENGGSVFLYMRGHDHAVIAKALNFLQAQPFTGVLFTHTGLQGTFQLEDARVQSPEAPDIILSMRWTADPSTNGTPGQLYSDDTDYRTGQGMHASLSPFDLHNTGVAAGPDFRAGFVDELPTGNTDIAPTIYWILGVEPPQKLAGRVLTEALAGSHSLPANVIPGHLEATHQTAGAMWRQYLDYSELEGVRYFERGNGEAQPAPGPVSR